MPYGIECLSMFEFISILKTNEDTMNCSIAY